MCPTEQDAQHPQDDETRRLLVAFEACRAKELAAADQLSKPRHSMLYPAYARLVDALGAVRLKCNDIRHSPRVDFRHLRHLQRIFYARNVTCCARGWRLCLEEVSGVLSANHNAQIF
jgi:hypothetical protein